MWKKILILIGICAFILGFYLARGDGLLHVTFLNVGQGDSILIQTPHGRNILVDGGPDSTINYRLGEELPFWNYKIDLMILTHADSDHLAGLIDVLRRYSVGAVLTSTQFADTPTYQVFSEELQKNKIPLRFIDAEDNFQLEENLFWDTLFPFDKTFDGKSDLNQKSVVARLVYGENIFLLTGDLEEADEWRLFERGVLLQSDVLKLAHHGSKTGNSLLFLQAVNPRFAVASVGANNNYGHPNTEVLERCEALKIPVLRTDELGSLHFLSDGKELKYLP